MKTIPALLFIAIILAVCQPVYAGVTPWPSDLNSPSNLQKPITTHTITESPITQNGMRSFSGQGISMQYPSSWMDAPIQYPNVIIFAKFLPTGSNQFRDNINIAYESLSQYGNMTLDEYYNQNIAGISKQNGFMKIGEMSGMTDGVPNKLITYSVPVQNVTLIYSQFFIVHNGIGYVITITATQQTLQNTIQEAGKALNTLRFKSNFQNLTPNHAIPENLTAQVEMKSFSCEKFSMQYPSSWVTIPGKYPQAIKFAKYLPTGTEQLRDNISIAYQSLAQYGNMTLDEYYNQTITAISQINGVMKQSTSSTTIDGVPCKVISYSRILNDIMFLHNQFLIVHNGMVYVITIVSTSNSKANALEEAEKAIKTIKFK